MINKFGSEEAYKAHMKAIGSRGGKGSSGYEFGHGKIDPVESGKKGAKTRWDKAKNEKEQL